MPYVFPANVFDEPAKLLSALGSFWATTYQGSFPVEAFLHARAQLDAQNHLDLLDLVASVSRFTVPVFHTDNWYLLTLKESERNQTVADLARFDGTYTFTDGQLQWGVPVATDFVTWPAPANLADVKVITNRVTGSTRTLTHGVDFSVGAGTISFRFDPFADPAFAAREVLVDNEVVDHEIGVWLYRGAFDLDNVYTQFGYALGLKLQSSGGYRDLVNAIFDGLVDGGTAQSTDRAFAAMAGVPLATAGEVVEHIFIDDHALWIITDQHAHRHHRAATPVVGVGDVLLDSQFMTDTVQVYEFGRGQVPAELRALTIGRGFLAAGLLGEVVFENKTVPLVVAENVDGFTRVSFAVGSTVDDGDAFWTECHRRGVAAGQTLAMLLDQRPLAAQDTQPTALALPSTINPLGFLLNNVFRNNLYVVKLKPRTFGPGATGLHHTGVLRKIIPPHATVITVVELAVADDPVILDGPGDETAPGYEEALESYAGTTFSETLDPVALVAETVRARQLAGACE